MKKSIKIIATLLLLTNHLAWSQAKQNVLLIMIDDLNDYVGCMKGAVKAITPNIDRLAQSGMLFTNAHCQAPICGPSRASIMTGFDPSTSGNYLQLVDRDIKKSNDRVANSIYMPDYFEAHGDKTMGGGKIFCKGDQANVFDEYGGKFSWFVPKPAKRLNYDPALIPGKVGNTSTDWGAFPDRDSLMTDYLSAASAKDKLSENHQSPFFMALSFIRSHVPWLVPQKWFDMYEETSINLPPYLTSDDDDFSPMAQSEADAPQMPTTEELIASDEWRNLLHAYLASITFMDAQLRKVLSALEESAYAENTVVVLMSDHGYHLGEKNRFAKQALWERSTKVPLIISDYGSILKQGTQGNKPVRLMDIFPILLDLCALTSNDQLKGHSLVPLIYGNNQWENTALTFYGEGNIAIRNERFRLIVYEDGSQKLYDMITDPNEWNNLNESLHHKSVIKHLKSFKPTSWSNVSSFSKYDFNEYFIDKC